MKGTSLILPIFMLLGLLSAYLFLHLSVLDFCVQIFFFSVSSCYLFLGDFLSIYCCVYASITLWPYACVPTLLFLWVSPFTFGLHLCFTNAALHTSLYLCVCLSVCPCRLTEVCVLDFYARFNVSLCLYDFVLLSHFLFLCFILCSFFNFYLISVCYK